VELAEVGQAITELVQDRFVRGLVDDGYAAKLASLEAEHARLSALPAEPDTIQVVSTGQTFADRWQDSDTQERRQLMRSAGFQIRVSKTATGQLIDAALRDELVRRHEETLGRLLTDHGVGTVELHEVWDEVRKLVDPDANLIIAFKIDPDLSRRAGLAAEGRPVPAPDVEEMWQEVLRPVRPYITAKR